jgi:hypothetical protein
MYFPTHHSARLFLCAALLMALAACARSSANIRALTPIPTAPAATTTASAAPTRTPLAAASPVTITAPPSPTLPPTPTQALAITFVPASNVPASNAFGYDPRFSVAARQAEEVAVIVAFLRAYNQGRLDEALALLEDTVRVSDCDYQTVNAVLFTGKSDVATWLRQRIADHDQLHISRIVNENPDDELVAGIEYTRRTSSTLQRLGFTNGIMPKNATKVLFTYDPVRIAAFVNAGGGGPHECQAE